MLCLVFLGCHWLGTSRGPFSKSTFWNVWLYQKSPLSAVLEGVDLVSSWFYDYFLFLFFFLPYLLFIAFQSFIFSFALSSCSSFLISFFCLNLSCFFCSLPFGFLSFQVLPCFLLVWVKGCPDSKNIFLQF